MLQILPLLALAGACLTAYGLGRFIAYDEPKALAAAILTGVVTTALLFAGHFAGLAGF